MANQLYFLSYQPVWQDVFGYETGDVLEFHRRKIDLCVAVIQLVGRNSGKEPIGSRHEFGRVSFTQFEALYSKKRGKKIYYLLFNDAYPRDSTDPVPEEQLALQDRYRGEILASGNLYAEISSVAELKVAILSLGHKREELEKLWNKQAADRDKILHRIQRTTERALSYGRRNLLVASAVLAAVIVSMGIVIGMFLQIRKDIAEIPRKEGALRQVQVEEQGPQAVLAAVLGELRSTGPAANAEAVVSAEVEASRKLGISVHEVRAQIAKAGEKANERLSLSSDLALLAAPRSGADSHEAEVRSNARETARDERIRALMDLAEIERLRIRFEPASSYVEEAAQLVDPGADPERWARIQWIRADLAFDQSRLERSEDLWMSLLPYYIRTAGPESKEALDIRNNIAVILGDRGRYQEAETEHRTILALELQKWGEDHKDTLTTRHNLAEVLRLQNRLEEAEQGYRQVIEDRTRVLGPDHQDTLTSRNNLGNVLRRRGKLPEAEAEHRAALERRERVLPPGHPQIIQSRNNLSVVLIHQGRLPEAEELLRTVLQEREHLLGPDHLDTLMTCYNLAYCLEKQGKYPEALALMRRAELGRTSELEADHPLVIEAREARQRIEGLMRDQ